LGCHLTQSSLKSFSLHTIFEADDEGSIPFTRFSLRCTQVGYSRLGYYKLPISGKPEIGGASIGKPAFERRRLPAVALAKAGYYRSLGLKPVKTDIQRPCIGALYNA
jgi:hypothetical protein